MTVLSLTINDQTLVISGENLTVAVGETAGINAGRTQFQAKASEDNGSITGGAGAVTGEASRLASGRTDAGEAASVDLPTNSRNIVAEVRELWNLATPSERDEIRAFTNSQSDATPSDAVAVPPAPQLPQAATAPHSNPQADSSPEADKAEASTSSPSASATNPSPAYLAGDDGHRGTPSSDALAAGQGESPDSIAKSGQAVTNPKPFCLKLKDGHCKIAFETAALCAQCNAAKARAA